ncbi:MAG: hypothetical protein Q9218_005859 [Villophora microphyllina]
MANSTEVFHYTPADPDGDAKFVFKLSEGLSTIQISTKVLSVSSTCFKAMFGPHFKEGNALPTVEAAEMPQMTFPEDDGEAMLQFWHSTRNIMRYCRDDDFPTEDQLSDPNNHELAILPEGFVNYLKNRREKALVELIECLEGAIQPFLAPTTGGCACPDLDNEDNPTNTSKACQRNAQVTHFFTELSRLGLWPASRLRKTGLKEIYFCTQQYQSLEGSRNSPRRRKPLSQCGCDFWKLQQRVQANAGTAALYETNFGGLCLTCVKEHKWTPEDNCHCVRFAGLPDRIGHELPL